VGILSGSLTYLRFRAEGTVPSNFTKIFEEALRFRRFVPLQPEGEDNESFGFVSLQKPYADEDSILNDQFLFGDCIALGYREDVISFPKAMMRDLVQKRLNEHHEKHQAKRDAQTKQIIQTALMSEMRKRILPKSKVVDFFWDLSRKEVRFFARGKGITDRFVNLFEQTFHVKLHLKTFAETAVLSNLSLMDKGILETLKPQELFKIIIRTEVN
jgi:recombination associated protein RdgC